MRAVPVIIGLLVLLHGALAQAKPALKTISSVFNGRLYYNGYPVTNTSLVEEKNDTMLVQTGVCSQITSLVPWYQALNDSSTCTVTIGEKRVHANYTILTTDDFLRKYDPSCVTYDILLAHLVALSTAFANQFYLSDIQLETRNRTQPAGPSGTGSTTIRVDGPLYIQGRSLRQSEVRSMDVVAKEVGENVISQFAKFLSLQRSKVNHINTEGRKIYSEPNGTISIRMEAQITFNNSMLVANGIDYSCPPFKELVKASLDSLVFYSTTSYLWKQVNILDEKSADTTASPTPEQTSTSSDSVNTVKTTTRGSEEEKSDGRSADTTTASPTPEQTSTSSDSVTTVRTTTRGGGARITWRLASMVPLLLTFSALLAML